MLTLGKLLSSDDTSGINTRIEFISQVYDDELIKLEKACSLMSFHPFCLIFQNQSCPPVNCYFTHTNYAFITEYPFSFLFMSTGSHSRRQRWIGTPDLVVKLKALIEACRCTMGAQKLNIDVTGKKENKEVLPRVCQMNSLLDEKTFENSVMM